MSDIYVPGLKSRFDTNKLVDDLMKVERIPKERSEKNIENLQAKRLIGRSWGVVLRPFGIAPDFFILFRILSMIEW